MKLTSEKFAHAAAFIRANGRELEQRLFDFHFNDGSAEAVLAALAAYQNEDGGFGNALEPDFRLPASSPMATSVALQVMGAVDAAADHPMVQRTVQYLLATYNKEAGYWPKTFTDVNDYPHAPWWHVYDEGVPSAEEWPNPTIELTGYLYRYDALVSDEMMARVTEQAQHNLKHGATIEDRYGLLCWLRAIPELPNLLRHQAEAKIRQTYIGWYPFDPDKLHELNLLAFAPAPDAILGLMYASELRPQLDALVESQEEDGGWSPGWAWGQYEDVWPVAKKEWRGRITLDNLLVLQAWNHIEG